MGYLHATDDRSNANLRRAAIVGSLMASFCVEGFSVDRLGAVTLHDVRTRYDNFHHLTRFGTLSI